MNDPLHIGLLTPSFRGFNTVDGGIASHFADLARGLADAGHDVRVLTAEGDASSDDPEQAGLRFLTIAPRMPRWLDRATGWRWQLNKLAGLVHRAHRARLLTAAAHRAEPFDVIETTSSGLLGLRLAGRRGVPPLVTRVSTTAAQLVAHNEGAARWIDRVEARLERRFVLRSDVVLTHTRQHRREVSDQWAIPEKTIALVPHGCALPAEAEVAAARAGKLTVPPRAPDAVEVLYVGRFEHRKGIDVLLAVLPDLLAACPGVRVRLIGSDPGDYWQTAFDRACPPGLRPRVCFPGKTDRAQLQAAYRDCDVFVAPSRYESFGLIYVEAMGWGKPVIGCRAGGMPEVIAEGEAGLLADPGDAPSLLGALLRLCRDPGLREQLGRQARRRAVTHFSREALARESAALYRQTVSAIHPA